MTQARALALRAAGLLAAGWLTASILATSPAGAAEFDAAIGKTGIGRCHMDGCSFFSIQTATPIFTLKDGTLFAISELAWSAEYKMHGDDDAHEYDRAPVSTSAKTPDAFLVFCSKTRPYIFFYGNGTWEVAALRPGDEAAMFGAAESAYSSYWAACHHFITKDPTAAAMAAKLGYRFSGGLPDGSIGGDGAIKEPRDLLK